MTLTSLHIPRGTIALFLNIKQLLINQMITITRVKYFDRLEDCTQGKIQSKKNEHIKAY